MLEIVWWADPGWTPGAHQKPLYHSSPELDKGEKIELKTHGSR